MNVSFRVMGLSMLLLSATPSLASVPPQESGLENKVIEIQSVATHTIRDPGTGNISVVRVATGGFLRFWQRDVGWSEMYRVLLDAPTYNKPIFVSWDFRGRSLLGVAHYDWTDAISTLFKVRISSDWQRCRAEAWIGMKAGGKSIVTYEITGKPAELLSTTFTPAFCSIRRLSDLRAH